MELKSRHSYIGFWQRKANYREASGEYVSCKSCINLLKRGRGIRTYYKCKLLKDSRSPATDIRLKNVCDFFEKAKYEKISSNGHPVVKGKIKIDRVVMFGLRPGDGVIKIGYVPEGNSKFNPRHRVQEFDDPIIYEGITDLDGDRWMSFLYREGGEEYHLLYQWILPRDGKEGDLIIPLVGEKSGSILIFRPYFKVVPVIKHLDHYPLLNFNYEEGE